MCRLGLLLAFLLAFLPEALATDVVVVDEEGRGVSGAHLMCIDPVGELARADRQGIAFLEDECRWARCDATGFLGGEVDLSRVAPICRLRRGFLLRAFFAEGAEGCEPCEARLLSRSDDSTVAVAAVHPGAAEAVRFPALPPGHYRLEISRDDGWTCSALLAPARASDRVLAVAWRGPRRIGGRVEDPDGEPAADIALRVESSSPALRGGDGEERLGFGAWECEAEAAPELRSGEDGSFEYQLDPAREHLIVAGSWDDEGLAAWALVPRGRAGGGELRLSLAAPARLLAEVQDAEGLPTACVARLGGLPPEAAWAAAVLETPFEARCDEAGQLRLGPFPAAPYSVEIRPEWGLAIRRSGDAAEAGGEVDLGLLSSERGQELGVSVIDSSGTPLPGAEIRATLINQLVVVRTAQTDESGSAQIRGIPPGAGISLEVAGTGFVSQMSEGLVAGDGPLVIALEPGGTIRGEVLDAAGEVLPGARVRYEADRRAGEARSDDAGRFVLESLPEGEIAISASLPGYRVREIVRIDLAAGSEAGGVILELDAAPRRTGRAWDALGKPVTHAPVVLIRERDLARFGEVSPLAQTATDGEGRFDLPLLDVEDAVVVIRAAGSGPVVVRQEAFPEGRDLDLVLPAAARLAVELPPGGPGTFRVQVLDGAGVGYVKEAAGGGEIFFEGLAPGTGSASLMREVSEALRLRPGRTAQVELRLGATLAGRVTRHGAGVGDAVVLAARPGAWGPTQITDEDGVFRFEGLAEGTRIVVAEGPGGRAEQEIELPATGKMTLDLALEEHVLGARVLDSRTREGIRGATVYLVPEEYEEVEPWFRAHLEPGAAAGTPGISLALTDTRGAVAISDALGLALLRVAQGGAHTLRVQAEGYYRNELFLDLEEGRFSQELLLESRARRGLTLRLETIPPGLGGALLCRAAGRPFSWQFAEGKGACEDAPAGPVEVFFHVAGVGSVRAEFNVPAEGVIEESVVLRLGGTLLVPVTGDSTRLPVVRDLDGVDWARVWRQIDPLGRNQPRIEYDPRVGDAWVFRDLPEGVYEVFVDGEARESVALMRSGRAVAR